MSALQDLLDEKVRRFLEARARLAETPVQIRSAARALDTFWWKKAQDLIAANAPPAGGHLQLSAPDRRLLDAGLVDPRLVGDGVDILERELDGEFATAIPGNIYYLSEWLQTRWELDVALRNIEGEVARGLSHFRDLPGYQNCHETRLEAIKKLQHLIRDLPGVSKPIYETLLSGRLMMHLEDMMFLELTGQSTSVESDRKLVQFFRSMLLRLRERCLTRTQQDMFSEWMMRQDRILKIIQDAAKDARVETTLQRRKLEQQVASANHMAAHLRLLHTLIPLGVATSDMKIPFCPLFDRRERCTKTLVRDHWRHLTDADPLLPGDPDILIAPFAGKGFFEWDRNTLVLPLTSEHSQGWALVHAVAGYRVMTDTLNFEGVLRKAWTAAFGPENFKDRFVEAYHNWVLGVGFGHRLAVTPEQFHFFLEHIGPNPHRGIGPSRLLKLDNDAQIQRLKDCRGVLNGPQPTAAAWYELAVIHWRRHNIREAYDAMGQAHQLNPEDPRIHFSMIYLGQRLNEPQAREGYPELIRRHPKTLWRVYAEIQMEGDRL